MKTLRQFQEEISYRKAAGEQTISVLLTFLFVLLTSVLCSCMGSIRVFDPLRSEMPVKLFNRYEIEFSGYEARASGFLMRFDVYFLTKISSESPISTIPILVIDSVCFSGACISVPVCRRMRSWKETVSKYPDFDHSWMYGRPLPGMDLWVRREVIIPTGYNLESGPYFAHACYGPSITAEINARLLDRATLTEIARETKTVKLEIRRSPAG